MHHSWLCTLLCVHVYCMCVCTCTCTYISCFCLCILHDYIPGIPKNIQSRVHTCSLYMHIHVPCILSILYMYLLLSGWMLLPCCSCGKQAVSRSYCHLVSEKSICSAWQDTSGQCVLFYGCFSTSLQVCLWTCVNAWVPKSRRSSTVWNVFTLHLLVHCTCLYSWSSRTWAMRWLRRCSVRRVKVSSMPALVTYCSRMLTLSNSLMSSRRGLQLLSCVYMYCV